MMREILNWHLEMVYSNDDNILCPSPISVNDDFYVFFGRQQKGSKKANLSCIKIDDKLHQTDFEIRFESDNEHSSSNGNLPNSFHSLPGIGTVLLCAEFTDSLKHKHLLIAHLHKIVFFDSYCTIGQRIDLDFINYDSDEFHTIAGMSYFEGSYYFAKGKEWNTDTSQSVPITEIYRYNTSKESEVKLKMALLPNDVALARPLWTVWNESNLLVVSARSLHGYSSRLFLTKENFYSRVFQNFYSGTIKTSEDLLTYQYPFNWKNHLWCIATLDFRGTKGFHLYRLREEK
jgi:hypothetical protein